MSDEDFEFDKPEYGSRDLKVALREADFDLARKILETCPEILQNEKNGGRGYWVVSQVKVSGVKGIKLLVEFGASVNDKWSDIKAIDSASSRGNFELVEWLIEQGATIQEEMPDGRLNCAALRSAVQHGHFAIVKRLVELGANVNSGAGIANALMDASAYGQTEIADYLRSHGAVDWRDTTPPDFKAGHERLLEHMIKRFGPLSDWSLELKQAPGVTLHLIEANKDSKFHTFFTIGLSDRRLPHPGDKYATCELRFRLSKKWRYTTRALANPKFNWPFVWLEKFVSDLIEAQQMPSFPIIIHDDPPAPLGVKTELSHWLCLHSMGEAVPVRDCRWIDIYDLHPVYAEEASFVREHGHEDFAMKMHEEKIPIQIDPKRKNICK